MVRSAGRTHMRPLQRNHSCEPQDSVESPNLKSARELNTEPVFVICRYCWLTRFSGNMPLQFCDCTSSNQKLANSTATRQSCETIQNSQKDTYNAEAQAPFAIHHVTPVKKTENSGKDGVLASDRKGNIRFEIAPEFWRANNRLRSTSGFCRNFLNFLTFLISC